jgi:dTDP-4-dehydrorhamnose reductase
MSKKIMILGSSGLLGSTLQDFFRKNELNIYCHARNGRTPYYADLSKESEVLEMLRSINPDVVINLAGLTNVDYCQEYPQDAYLSNVKIIENMKEYFAIDNPNSHLIHISTDHMYDSPIPSKINELNIKNFYAFSKYAGELAAMSLKNVSILRTNFFGLSLTSARSSFTDWVYESAKNKNDIAVFQDIKFSPLSMRTLAKYINMIIEKGPIGLANLGSREGMSKADFAYFFVNQVGLDCAFMTKVNAADAQVSKIPRPFDMRMDSTPFEQIFNIQLPTLKKEIICIAEEYYEKAK